MFVASMPDFWRSFEVEEVVVRRAEYNGKEALGFGVKMELCAAQVANGGKRAKSQQASSTCLESPIYLFGRVLFISSIVRTGRVAQWIRRWTSDPAIASSSLAVVSRNSFCPQV